MGGIQLLTAFAFAGLLLGLLPASASGTPVGCQETSGPDLVPDEHGTAGNAVTGPRFPPVPPLRLDIRTACELVDVLRLVEDPSRTALEAARTGSRWQATTLGGGPLAVEALPSFPSVSAAARAVAVRHGVVPNAEGRAKLLALDTLDEPERAALTRVFVAYLMFDEAARKLRPFADADRGAMASMVSRIAPHLARLFAARITLFDAALALRSVLTRHAATTSGTPTLDLCPALALELEGNDTTYEKGCALVIDVGGDDTYYNNAGGSDFRETGCVFPGGTESVPGGAGALIDLAGNDAYGDPTDPKSCGANGGAFAGAGFLVDLSGDDRYTGADRGINGGGAGESGIAVGFLADLAGDDVYTAGTTGTNGGGFGVEGAGVGLLIDLDGADTYTGGDFGVNGGAWDLLGVAAGFLLDGAGNDTYSAGRQGTNGGGWGNAGVAAGFLVDAAGDDRYAASEGATNGGAWSNGGFGVGLLMEAGGNDTYSAGRQGTNGGAASDGNGGSAVGRLIDLEGDDSYVADDWGANGGARASVAGFAFGFLADHDGHDTYSAGNEGTNGGAWSSGGAGVGVLLDGAGDDAYVAGSGGTNGGAHGDDGVALGLLADGGGTDTYEDDEFGAGTDSTAVPKGSGTGVGARIDGPDRP